MAVPGVLYLIPTPIGNLGDISHRMVQTIAQVDFLAAEDTRVTVKLLNHLGVKKPMISYHRHNTAASGAAIVKRLLAGESCGLVTDAGTPAISDPGEELVALCAEHQIRVEAIPGPCALICALSISGLPTVRFTFEGFLPQNKKNRRVHLDTLREEQRTMVFYEAPHKLEDTLKDFQEVFGSQRRITLCRELSKLHEEVVRTTVEQALEQLAHRPPRGEYVLVVEGRERLCSQQTDPQQALERVEQLREDGMSLKDACTKAGEEFGFKKRQLYEMALGK